MPTLTQQKEYIRSECVKANPTKEWIHNDETEASYNTIWDEQPDLADILLAIWKKDPANRTNVTLESSGQFITRTKGENPILAPEWNLTKPFDQQEDSTITFIYELLKKSV